MSESKPPLTILALETENVLKIRSLHIEPKPSGLIIVGGDNGAGKTSTIDSIWFALGGKPNAKFPIHEGEKEGKVTLDLGDLTVVRRFRYKENGELASDLKITNKDGATYNSPQKMLDGLITKIAFDPFEFAELEAKKQVDAFRVALGIDTTELDKEEKQTVEDRQLVNREIQTILARNQGMPEYEDVPDEPVSVEELSDKLSEANTHNAQIAEKESKLSLAFEVLRSMDTTINLTKAEVERLRGLLAAEEAKLAEYESKREAKANSIGEAEAALQSLVKIDTTAIQQEFAALAETNRKVAANKALREARVEFEAKEQERVALELKVDEIRAARKRLIEDAVREAEFAVGGIDVREDGLYLGDLPFAQANTAEKLKFSVALALKQNPRLRVFRIADGEKIMPKNLEILERIAVEAGAQIWVEHAMTREDVEGGFRTPTIFIEDGHVVEVTKAGGN